MASPSNLTKALREQEQQPHRQQHDLSPQATTGLRTETPPLLPSLPPPVPGTGSPLPKPMSGGVLGGTAPRRLSFTSGTRISGSSPPLGNKWPKPGQPLSPNPYHAGKSFQSNLNAFLQTSRSPSPFGSPVSSQIDIRAAVESAKNVTPNIGATPNVNNVSRSRTLQEILTSVSSIVKNRTGSVLARNTILKSDHFDTGHSSIPQEFHLQGAQNFRLTDFNVFGVAEPTLSGISTILTLLGCHPGKEGSNKTVFVSSREEPIIYLNWRPFVLRENHTPFQNIKTYQGISGPRLEQMEARLKEDILREAHRYNNLLLVHDEIENGKIVPSWIAVGEIQTPKEVFEAMKANGYRVMYTRIPISAEQAPEDSYLDEFVRVIQGTTLDDPLIFNCGMGVGRTTFAMVAAVLCRRAQMLAQGETSGQITAPLSSSDSWLGRADALFLDEVYNQNRAVLRLVSVLEKGLSGTMNSKSAIDWALARGPLIDDLKNAVLGNYQQILQLVSVLQNGAENKRVLDEAINRCDAMINLREVILLNRVKYSNTGDMSALEKAQGCLERYFFLLAFCSYISENVHDNFSISFSSWLKGRTEISRNLEYMRRKGARLELFRPVEDLTVFAEERSLYNPYGRERLPMANELEKFVIKGRQGSVLVQHTILKADQWPQQQRSSQIHMEGAANFRKIPGWHLFGVAQPTIQGMKCVIESLTTDTLICRQYCGSPKQSVCWINLREEPISYVNGQPYVLRDQTLTLRNLKSYSGITATRLEQIESRLKEDVLAELKTFENRILVHIESAKAEITPIWEDCIPQNVLTVREVIDVLKREGVPIEFYRVPVTAEQAPDETDYDRILQILSQIDLHDTAIVLNCQVGLGRSTTGTIICSLVLHWLKGLKPGDPLQMDEPTSPSTASVIKHARKPLNYQVIHSLMRVIRNGAECRRWVDETIDMCSTNSTHIRDVIETWRLAAEGEASETQKRRAVRKGLLYLRRYFGLLAFAAYLDSRSPNQSEVEETFVVWMSKRKEFATMLEEMERGELQSLVPVEHFLPGDGIALTTEVVEVVNNRSGPVLAKQTILKVDVFPGAQKPSLIERVEGAPNYRKIDLAPLLPPSVGPLNLSVYGIGMPTKDAICTALTKVGAGPNGSKRLLWTSLREEPVIYIKGRPFVLRLFQDPMKNLEITGIERERVEQMEEQMKADCIKELKLYGGRLLLHSEEQTSTGFSIVPVWETVTIEEIETPLQVYNSIVAQGYQVDYKRVPITDEQAPIPDVFDQIVERLAGFEGNTEAMFNCQMGRGRTTTGIVTACLLKMIVGIPISVSLENISASEQEVAVSTFNLSSTGSISSTAGGGTGVNDDDRLRSRFLNGEYKVILQLLSVLENGRLAKSLTDKAIDRCEHVQNLRKAIYDYKLRIEALEAGSKKWQGIRDVGVNYLVRYFYLIVFADYLLELYSSKETIGEGEAIFSSDPTFEGGNNSSNNNLRAVNKLKFSEWLVTRREITGLIDRNPGLE